MRLALIGPGIMPIPPKGWGAVETLIWDMHNALIALGHEVDIVNVKDPKSIIRKVNEFKPDFVWIKMISHDGDNHHLYDSVRGAAKSIFANTDDDEQTSDTDRLSSFTIDGFTLGNNYRVNGSGKTFVAWCWKAGGGTGAGGEF